MTLQIGQVVPGTDTVVERELGHGSFGMVYLCSQALIGRRVAVKELARDHQDPNKDTIILREIRTMGGLTHPHITTIYQVQPTAAFYYIIMEYAALGSLRALLSSGAKIPIPRAIEYTMQIASALQAAHNNRIIHRDVKPENILIKQGDVLQLCDFGIAQRQHLNGTVAYTPVGTQVYAPLEQCMGRPQFVSDEYALAVTSYELFCGAAPDYPPYIYASLGSTLPPLDTTGLNVVSTATWQVVAKGLANKPEDRYPTVMEYAEALAQSLQPTAPVQIQSFAPQPPAQLPPSPAPAVRPGRGAPFSSFPGRTLSQDPTGVALLSNNPCDGRYADNESVDALRVRLITQLLEPTGPSCHPFFQGLTPLLIEAMKTGDYTLVAGYALQHHTEVKTADLIDRTRLLGVSTLALLWLRCATFAATFLTHNSYNNNPVREVIEHLVSAKCIDLFFESDQELATKQGYSIAVALPDYTQAFRHLLASAKVQRSAQPDLWMTQLSAEKLAYIGPLGNELLDASLLQPPVVGLAFADLRRWLRVAIWTGDYRVWDLLANRLYSPGFKTSLFRESATTEGLSGITYLEVCMLRLIWDENDGFISADPFIQAAIWNGISDLFPNPSLDPMLSKGFAYNGMTFAQAVCQTRPRVLDMLGKVIGQDIPELVPAMKAVLKV
ncbi:MAG TPA: serine/threonine-protein kinase [Candidatus Acidoferrum sp.]|nr:serine/threonine-protein kinase [Candidatus Acidoferrum sp.]